jgi:hypothetical protein
MGSWIRIHIANADPEGGKSAQKRTIECEEDQQKVVKIVCFMQ